MGFKKGYTSTALNDIEVQKRLYINCAGDTEVSTNACESFHSACGKYFYSAHPNTFVFFEFLSLYKYIKIKILKRK